MDYFELSRAESLRSFHGSIENFRLPSFSFWFLCKWRGRARKGHKVSLHDFLVFFSNVSCLTVSFRSRALGKTASLQTTATSLSETANTLRVDNLQNHHLVVFLPLLQDLMTSILLKASLSFVKPLLVHTNFDRSSRVLCFYFKVLVFS